jgi:hypothetical protein
MRRFNQGAYGIGWGFGDAFRGIIDDLVSRFE